MNVKRRLAMGLKNKQRSSKKHVTFGEGVLEPIHKAIKNFCCQLRCGGHKKVKLPRIIPILMTG